MQETLYRRFRRAESVLRVMQQDEAGQGMDRQGTVEQESDRQEFVGGERVGQEYDGKECITPEPAKIRLFKVARPDSAGRRRRSCQRRVGSICGPRSNHTGLRHGEGR